MMIFLTTIILQETLVACLFSILFCELYCTLSTNLGGKGIVEVKARLVLAVGYSAEKNEAPIKMRMSIDEVCSFNHW